MIPLTWKPYRKSLASDIASLWNRALGEHFPMSAHLLRQNTEGAPSFQPNDSTVVTSQDQVVGYILTKRFHEPHPYLIERLASTGWIEALIVDPAWQRKGLGRDLLAWAVCKLRSGGADKLYLGSGFCHFFPGVPAELPGLRDYFSKAGFRVLGVSHDLRGSLRGFAAPPSALAAVTAVGGSVRPCRAEDIPALIAFLQAEFPGRWHFDTKRFLSLGGNPQEIIILRQGQAVIGFAHVFHWRASYQGPPIYWHKLMGPHYGGLGPIGVAAGMRGKGLGLALLQLALQHVADVGVQDAVIDWTTLTDFYGRVGFTPWKTYIRMEG